MKYITYDRVSSEEQRSNTSGESQQKGISNALPEILPLAVKVRAFSDVASARTSNRPGLKQAYSYCKWYNQVSNSPITHLVVYAWDRFFRERDLSAEWRRKFREIGVEVNAVTEWIDFSDSGEIIVLSVREALAQAESMKNSERTTRGMKARMSAGYWVFSPPLGYRKAATPDSKGKRVIESDPTTAPAKAKAMGLIAEGLNIKKAWRQCGGSDVLGSYNNFLEKIVNPFDLGLIDYTWPDGEHVQAKGQHPAIITEGLQKAVKKRLAKNARKGAMLSRRTQSLAMFPARRVLVCPSCFRGLTSSQPRMRNGQRAAYYSCANGCKPGYNLRKDVVTPDLIEMLRTVKTSDQAKDMLERKADAAFSKRALQEDLKKAVAQLDNVQKSKKKAYNLLLEGSIEPEDYDYSKGLVVEAEEKVREARLSLQGYDAMRSKLTTAFADIGAAIAKGLEDGARAELSLKTHDFLAMAFPDGLCYASESSTFRTKIPNRFIFGTGLLSVSYDHLKTTSPTDWQGLKSGNQLRGAKAGTIRTLSVDRQLLSDYLKKYA